MLKYGIETEACIVDHNGDILPRISDSQSSFEFIQELLEQRAKQKVSNIIERISPEELGHQIEIKNPKPFEDLDEALENIERDLREINEIKAIRDKMQLIITPVCQTDFEIVPSIGDPEAHQRKLFDKMINKYGEEEGEKVVKSFSVFSTQVNIGGLFEGVNQDINDPYFQELARRFLNEITKMQDILRQDNGKIRDYNGKTREEVSQEVLTKLKGEHFDKQESVIIPPIFNTTEEMFIWIGKHCEIDFTETRDTSLLREKDLHSFLAKLKWMTYKGIELRAFDASMDLEAITTKTNTIVNRLNEVKDKFLQEIKRRKAA